MNKLSTSIVNHKYLFYFHICMENSDPSIRSILKQIAHRYLGQHYPTLAQLTPLHLAHDLLSLSLPRPRGILLPNKPQKKFLVHLKPTHLKLSPHSQNHNYLLFVIKRKLLPGSIFLPMRIFPK